jgi:hypothetical protein
LKSGDRLDGKDVPGLGAEMEEVDVVPERTDLREAMGGIERQSHQASPAIIVVLVSARLLIVLWREHW